MRRASVPWIVGAASLLLAGQAMAGSLPETEAALGPRNGLPDLVAALLAGGAPGDHVAQSLRALAQAEGLPIPAGPSCPTLGEALSRHAQRFGVAVPALPIGLDANVARAVACLLSALHGANEAMDATFADLTQEQRFALYGSEDEPSKDLLALLDGRSHAKNLVAAIHVAEAVQAALPILQAALFVPPIDAAPILRIDALGDTLHEKNYALTIDLLGNDTYDNHAGGIFLAAGSTIYDVQPGSAWFEDEAGGQRIAVGGQTQDADFAFSVGLAIDVLGDDVWGVKRPPLMADDANGCGTSERVPIVDTIGGGVFGVGMAFDLSGDNEFYGRTQTQGAGHILGVGVLYNGPGRDSLEAVRGGIGSGLLGGIGLYIDAGGDSEYRMASPVGGVFNGDRHFCDDDPRYGIGSSFDRKDGPPAAHEIGIFADLGGDDHYDAAHKSVAFGQGLGFGLVLDAQGDDRYDGEEITQGAGHGRALPFDPEAFPSGGLALLLDLLGNDSYAAVSQAQGWGMGDLQEDPVPPSQLDPLLQWTIKREEAVGILFDATGADTYSGPSGRGDGQHGTDGTLGVYVDLE